MADVNSHSRKRRSPSVEIIFKINGEDVSDMASPIIENTNPKAKIAKKDDLVEDSDSNLYHDLSQNSVETNISVQEKILELQEENMKLKRQLQDINGKLCKCSFNMVKETEDVPDSQDRPIINIKFFNKPTADLYKSKFERFLESFCELTFNNEHLEINVLKNNNITCVIQSDITSPETNKLKRKRKKSKTEAAKELFVLDTTPSLAMKGNENLKYTSKYSVPINGIADIKEETKKETCSQTCFNCDRSHALRDCPEPKNFAKINAARQKLKSQNIKVRYHLEDEQKYSHILPGKISQNLKTALGVRSNQLPEYIYRMRVIGYPPGWMEEAQVIHSDISLYDIEGKNIRCSKRNKQGSVDPNKVIEYVGFNVPIEKDVKDDYERYKCPPYSEKCSKYAMLDFITKMEEKDKDNLETCDMEIDLPTDEEIVPPGCVPTEENNKLAERLSPSLVELEKKKLELLAALDENATNSSSGGDENLNNVGTIQVKQTILTNDKNLRATVNKIKMTITNDSQNEDFIDSGIIKTKNVNTVEINNQTKELKKGNDEEIKESLEIPLQIENTDGNEIPSNINQEINTANELAEHDLSHKIGDASTINLEEIEYIQKSDTQIQDVVNTKEENSIIETSPRTPISNVKKSSLGTPILKSASPFISLPNPENFSKGVSPVINFENLPNSTGKYEQMTTVLFRVRRTLKNINDRS